MYVQIPRDVALTRTAICLPLGAQDTRKVQASTSLLPPSPGLWIHPAMQVYSGRISIADLSERLGDHERDLLTFHCVIRDKYPTEAVQLRIHMSSACWEI